LFLYGLLSILENSKGSNGFFAVGRANSHSIELESEPVMFLVFK